MNSCWLLISTFSLCCISSVVNTAYFYVHNFCKVHGNKYIKYQYSHIKINCKLLFYIILLCSFCKYVKKKRNDEIQGISKKRYKHLYLWECKLKMTCVTCPLLVMYMNNYRSSSLVTYIFSSIELMRNVDLVSQPDLAFPGC